jgi:hypothetical protein
MKAILSALIPLFAASQLVAADFTVTNTNNSGPGSLYQAIADANSTPGADRILFNIPGAGVQKIDVGKKPLPKIIESVVIDGYSQPGAKANSLAVGDNAIILIQLDSGIYPNNTPEGLLFDRTKAANGQDYLVSDYSLRGVALTGFGRAIRLLDANSIAITGNFIGLLPDGHTRAGGGEGITIDGITTGRAIIGGTDPSARNVISGNNFGIWVPNGARATVQGNYIGTDASGTGAVANSWAGVVLVGDLYDTVIGGITPGAGNLISGNNLAAIMLGWGAPSNTPQAANGARISGNFIGVQSDGIKPLGNIGWAIALEAGIENIIGGLEPGAGNLIANNGLGIVVGNINADQQTPPAYNRIFSNTIYNNRAVGIDLGNDGPTANDEGDADIGANALQNAPVIESAELTNGSVTIKGSLESTGNTQFTLQYFSESLDLVRPVQTYLGTTIVTTDDNGRAQFSTTWPVSKTNVSFNMTATSENGNTSEFSRNAPRMLNISTRAIVQTGDRVLIAGFIVRSNLVNREAIVRALGPSLLVGGHPLPGTLSDPLLEYHYPGDYFITNDNWRDASNSGYVEFYGLVPPAERESAFFLPYLNGNSTVVVRGAHGETGIAVAEVYDLRGGSFGGFGDVSNISTRGFVGTGDDAMIAGMILEQTSGLTRLVVRALGPSLAAVGVTDPLSDPILELRDNQGALIASNDNWRDGQRDALIAVGLAPTKDNESAIFMRLPSGSYTAIVHGKDESTGVALVELYNLH